MSLKVLSIVGVAAKLIAVLPIAEAQSTTVKCLAEFDWMNNSRNQSPCLVAAYAQGACNGGQFTVDPLLPGTHYTGPSVDEVNPCQCCTVVYSLVSACAICQNRTAEGWDAWQTNCSVISTGQFPEAIPSGTTIPAWAYLDVVVNDTFSTAAAEADLSAPESTGIGSKPTGTVFTTAASTVSIGTSPNFSTATGIGGNSAATSKKSNAGAIAGGVVGGLVGLGIIAGLIVLFLRRRRQSRTAPSASYSTAYNDTPRSDAPPNSLPPMNQPLRLYDPSDPSTYPTSPTIHTTNSDSFQQSQPGQYSGVPEL